MEASRREGARDGRPRGVLALIPAYDEAATIGEVVASAASRLPVLVVDDGSSDSTGEVAVAAGAEVLRHPRNLGKGAALKSGFRWACARGFEAVLTIDADGQHDPADMDDLLARFDREPEALVIGERSFREMPWPRWWSQPLGSWLLSRALGAAVTDNQSGYRLLPRSFIERIELTADGYEMEVEMIAEAVRVGVSITWVPIRTIYDGPHEGFRPVLDTARFLKMVWRIWRRRVNGTQPVDR